MNEPVEEVRDFLRIRVTPDPNVAGRDNPGGEWIYTFFPRFNVTMDSFPIISITQINELGKPFGLGSTVHWQHFQFQIDVWIKEDNILTMGGIPREGKESALYLVRQVSEAFRQYWISDFAETEKFKLFEITGKKPIVYDFERKLWRISLNIEFEMDIRDGWLD